MAIDERSRHDLFSRLEKILGQGHAVVLMEHLPPVGWADVATKHDLDQLEARLEARLGARIEVSEQRLLATFRAEINAQTRIMIFSMATVLLGIGGVALTAARL
jgi:3-phosphoglycerate kinase